MNPARVAVGKSIRSAAVNNWISNLQNLLDSIYNEGDYVPFKACEIISEQTIIEHFL